MSEEKRPRARRVRSSADPVRHGQLTPRSPLRSLLGFIGGALAVVLIAMASVAGIAVWDISRGMNQGVELQGAGNALPPLLGELEGSFNILLVGSDSREGYAVDEGEGSGGNLNDVNMLMHVSADHKQVTVVSFPRDMMVPIPECPDGEGGFYPAMSAQPLNSAIGYGGLACVAITLSALTGLEIPYAAMIGFNGVMKMADAVGGVEVCIAQDINDPESAIQLAAGTHELSGQEALLFIRNRHGVGDGSDLARIGSQQVFMSSLARKIMTSDTLTDVTKVYKLAQASAESLTLSSNIANVTALASLAWTVRNVDIGQIAFVRYPVVSYEFDSNKVAPDYVGAEILLDAISTDKNVEFTQNSDNGVTVEAVPSPEPQISSSSAPESAPPVATAEPVKEVAILPSNAVGQLANQNSCVG